MPAELDASEWEIQCEQKLAATSARLEAAWKELQCELRSAATDVVFEGF